MTEKRKRTRAQAGFAIDVDLAGEVVTALTMNVSLTGLSCTASPRFQEGTPCRVTVNLGSGVTIIVQGKIMRATPRGAAITFTSMDEDSFRHLKNLVALNAGNADVIERELTTPAFSK